MAASGTCTIARSSECPKAMFLSGRKNLREMLREIKTTATG